ncbi:MAG: GNAT family N-acetyltransferase [Pseudomonadota bacterium]
MQVEELAQTNRNYAPGDPGELLLPRKGQAALCLNVTIHSEFEDLRSDWETFEKTALSTPFQSYSWLSAWYDKIGKPAGEEPVIVALRDGQQQLMMLMALSRVHTPVGNMLVDMGQPVCDYHAPLYAHRFLEVLDAEAMNDVWDFILQSLPDTDLVSLTKQPEALGKTPNPMAWVCTKPYFTPNSYQMSLAGYDDWHDLLSTKRSGKARSRMNGKRNKLAKLGEVEFHAITEPAERANLAAKLLSMKTRDLARTGKNSIFTDRHVRDFILEVSGRKGENDNVVMHVLTCAGKEVAITYSLNWHHTMYYYIASYERGQYERSSPGALALCRVFEWCLDEKIKTFDFTIGDEGYKLEWSDRTTGLVCGTFAVTAKGRVGERLEAAKLSLKHTIKSSPIMYKVASRLLYHFRR